MTKKLFYIMVTVMVLAGCLLMSGCSGDEQDSGSSSQFVGTYGMYYEDGTDLGTTITLDEDGTATSRMSGEYDFTKKKDGTVQLVINLAANKDDPVTYDIEKTDYGYDLKNAGSDSAADSISLEPADGTDGISGDSAFSGTYSVKDRDGVKYIFNKDKSFELETADTWSVDGDTMTLSKAAYSLTTETDNDAVKSMTLKSEDGTSAFTLKRH